MEALSDVLKHARAIAQPLSTEISTDARVLQHVGK